MTKHFEYISNSYEDTLKIASEFAKTLKKGDVVTLNGDLGAGKTAFTSGVVSALGSNDRVQSPTFTIVNEYRHGSIPVFHFDVYRILDSDEMYDIGFDDYIFGEGVCIIEWAENISDIIDFDRYEVNILKSPDISDDYRKITVNFKKGR